MSNTPKWNISPGPAAEAAEATLHNQDRLLDELANASFAPATEPVAPPVTPAPWAVASQPVHDIDLDYWTLHAALQDGTIPTFAEQPSTAPGNTPSPVSAAAEREAYTTFLQFVHQHKEAGTTVTSIDPNDYEAGLI